MAFGFGGSVKKQSYLGVDIGVGGVKVVELANEKGRAHLLTYGYSERKPGDVAGSPFDDVKGTAQVLAEVCKQAGTKSTKAMAALPLSSIFSTIIAVPRKKDEKELKPLIDAQVAKLTPLPIAEMITYSTFIDDLKEAPGGKPSEYVRVLVTGAAKTLVQKYIDIFRQAKLELQAIDTESFALVRALIGKDKSAILILDMGSSRSSISIVEKGIPFLTRSINVGGNLVTKKIMEQMKVTEAEAEQMKKDLPSLPPMLESALAPILHEIQYALQLYARMELTELKRVEKVIVTGGSAHLPNLPEYLAAALNLNVYRGDPWARVSTPVDLRPVLDDVGPRMAVAIGLAMREID
jgi:type IV pilus assembly protein PilM